jgi:hypothetical protein
VEVRRCRWCGSPLSGRPHKQYCNHNCRQNAWRWKKRHIIAERKGRRDFEVVFIVGNEFPSNLLWDMKYGLERKLARAHVRNAFVKFQPRDEATVYIGARSYPDIEASILERYFWAILRDAVVGV